MLAEAQLDWGEMKGQRGSLTQRQLKANAFNAANLRGFEEEAPVSSVVLCGNFLALKFVWENDGFPIITYGDVIHCAGSHAVEI